MGSGLPSQGQLSLQPKEKKGPRGWEGQPGLRSSILREASCLQKCFWGSSQAEAVMAIVPGPEAHSQRRPLLQRVGEKGTGTA